MPPKRNVPRVPDGEQNEQVLMVRSTRADQSQTPLTNLKHKISNTNLKNLLA
jgi:hypothetical protein